MDFSTAGSPSVQPQLQLFDPQGEPLAVPPFPVRLRITVPCPCTIEVVLTPRSPVTYARLIEHKLTPLDQRILTVLKHAEKPLKGASVAARAGLTSAESCRRQLASLRRRGLIEKVSGGYQVVRSDPDATA